MSKINKYGTYLSDINYTLPYRESIEWSNTWVDKANATCERRILLIGDSNARMVRSTLARMSGLPVDLLASSAALDDYMFVNQVDSFFLSNQAYSYQTIFVQLGHHGIKNRQGGLYDSEEDYVKFRADFTALLHFLLQFCDNIVVESIFDNVVPEGYFAKMLQLLHLMDEKSDERYNSIKHRKNEIMHDVVKTEFRDKKHVFFYDILHDISSCRFLHKDHIHYYKRTYKWIAKHMLYYV